MSNYMNRHRIETIFKDKDGNWAVVQLPNFPIIVWLILTILNFFVHSLAIENLSRAVLLTWSYLELMDGDSVFRRVLGAIVMVVCVIGFVK